MIRDWKRFVHQEAGIGADSAAFACLIVVCALFMGAVPSIAAEAAGTTPNIIVFLTDDQPFFTLCGDPDTPPGLCPELLQDHPMPTVESRLIGEGSFFTQAIMSQPLCCPARSAMLSGGFYSFETNVLDNGKINGGAPWFSDSDTLPVRLQEAGYSTILVGKYMNRYRELVDKAAGTGYIPPGWDYFAASDFFRDWNNDYDFVIGSSTPDAAGVGSLITVNDGTHITDYERDQSLAQIDALCAPDCTAPFFLFLAFHLPHTPATPAPRNADLFPDFLYRGRGWGEGADGDFTDKPTHYQVLAESWDPTAGDLLQRDMVRSLRGIDEAVAAIIASLEDKGILEETVIFYASDNGLMWGGHRLEGKDKPYEESLRVPFIVRRPGSPQQVVDGLVSVDLDLPATIFELSGAASMGQGSSLLPLIDDPTISWREDLLAHGTYSSALQPWTALRTQEWKYIEYASGETELYDLVNDPYELESKHADPLFDSVRFDLDDRLQQRPRALAFVTADLPDPLAEFLPEGLVGEPYAFQLTAWGGDGVYLWSVRKKGSRCKDDLPVGLVLSADGLIQGTPTSPGAFEVCLEVVDGSVSPQPGNGRPQIHAKKMTIEIVSTRCEVQCLRAASIGLRPFATKVGARVTVNDEAGSPVEGVQITAHWTLPDLTEVVQQLDTDSQGRARFEVDTKSGDFTLTVDNLAKEGWTFDVDKSLLERTVTVE